MQRTLVRDVAGHEGEVVRVCGWFDPDGDDRGPALRDHTGRVALVGVADPPPPESAVDVVGEVVLRDGGGTAVAVDRLEVAGRAESPLPIDASSPLGDRLDWRYLDLRRPQNRLLIEVQTTAEAAMRAWWNEHGFVEIHTPKLRATPNYSGRELFTVPYFDRTAYLAQSPQFSKQMAMAAGLDRIFEIGPVFRANPLTTTRHDTEFTSVDVEVAWIESHEDLMAMEEIWLAEVVGEVAGRHGADIERLFGRPLAVPALPFPRVTMDEAQAIVAAEGHRPTIAGDLDAEAERLVGARVKQSLNHDLVFVTEYPASVRPFYHRRLDDRSEATRSFDLLWNGLEVTTGAQREHRYDVLVAQAQREPSRVAAIGSYLDFFRYGCPPHGGFGFGLTRMLMCLLGLDDVREATFLFRGPDRLSP